MLPDAGVDSTRAAGIAGTIGAALIFGRIVVGYLLDRLPAVALAQCLFAMVAAGMLTLVAGGAHVAVVALIAAIAAGIGIGSENDIMRSEEHTSELQSLMRISYAVFCFKKKNKPRED